eukprot:TRINITY_DN1706_c0_g1_i2.p2 TRINITY_DN1706_c0_g1~~TRINITY_DN1706_c0_g1_i2.p2  ORF type:complete len:106 (-),score=25.04 TRINITY_DN1706_c0_g1_i2:54-371(-)
MTKHFSGESKKGMFTTRGPGGGGLTSNSITSIARAWVPWAARSAPTFARWGAVASLAIIYATEPYAVMRYVPFGFGAEARAFYVDKAKKAAEKAAKDAAAAAAAV